MSEQTIERNDDAQVETPEAEQNATPQAVFTEDVTPYTLARTAEAVVAKLGLTRKAPTPNQLYGYARKSVEADGKVVSGISAYDDDNDKRWITAETANSWLTGFVQGKAQASGAKVDYDDLAERFVNSHLA